MRRTIFIALFAMGCGKTRQLKGDWAGTCTFDNDEVDVEFDIKKAKYGILEGDILFAWETEEWDGPLEGTVSKDIVEITFDVEFDGGYLWAGYLDGELDHGDIVGDMDLDGLSFQLNGECQIEQD